MAVWLVLAGRKGERESFALVENSAVIGFDELPVLSQVHTSLPGNMILDQATGKG
jgi:restriction system protein